MYYYLHAGELTKIFLRITISVDPKFWLGQTIVFKINLYFTVLSA